MIPREFRKGSKPFNPIELAKILENIVVLRRHGTPFRKYSRFSIVRFYGRIPTAYVVGCNLRCYFCWCDPSRDYPEKYGRYYSPYEVVSKLVALAKRYGRRRVRISGGEPTIGFEHLIKVLELLEDEKEIDYVIIETNGILLGYYREHVARLSKFSKVIVRVSIKAGTPQAFYERTGAEKEFFIYPFNALEELIKHNVKTYAAAILDPRIVNTQERKSLISLLCSIDPKLFSTLEEEVIEPYPRALQRMQVYGLDTKNFFHS